MRSPGKAVAGSWEEWGLEAKLFTYRRGATIPYESAALYTYLTLPQAWAAMAWLT